MALEIARAKSVADAANLLADSGVRILGGGTLLVRDASAGDVSVEKLVIADGLGLDAIKVEGGRVTLGAAVTMAAVARHPGMRFLHAVAREIGGPAVRSMATVGGNLFARAPYGDFTVALLALGAEVTSESGKGGDTADLEAFLAARDKSRRLVTSVSFPLPATNAFRFVKVTRRHPHGASVLSIAALLPLADGRVKGARVAYGAMAPTAIRAKAVEQALDGQALDSATIAKAASVAAEGTSATTDPFATDWYRRSVIPVHLTRLLSR